MIILFAFFSYFLDNIFLHNFSWGTKTHYLTCRAGNKSKVIFTCCEGYERQEEVCVREFYNSIPILSLKN